jgi:hypothetical protein
MHSWSTFGARMSHGHIETHKIHHDLDSREATTFPLIVFFVISHGATSFCLKNLGIPKFPKLGLLTCWKAITSFLYLWLKWDWKQSCSPHWERSNDMWHDTYEHAFQGDFKLLMVKSQNGTLTLSFSFGHNLCFSYSNESCEPILDI